MSDTRITKVRYKVTADGERIEIHETETSGPPGAEHTREIVHKCAEQPAPELPGAFRALSPHVRAILELPSDFAEGRLQPTSVSFSMSKNDIEGAVISGYVSLAKGDGSWIWNTPHLPFEPYGDGGGAAMTAECVEACEAVREHARAYLNGERAQGGLFDGVDGKSAAAGEGREEVVVELFPQGGKVQLV
jgi:hypothetical protein